MVPIPVPSLAERREDIPELTRHFIDMFHRTQGLPMRVLSPEAEAMLQTMQWPGNVRQLRNVIERVLILGDGSGPIEARELPGQEVPAEAGGRMVLGGAMATLPLREAREVFEREYLLTQINRFGGNISRTAGFRRHGTLGPAPQTEVAGRGDHLQERQRHAARMRRLTGGGCAFGDTATLVGQIGSGKSCIAIHITPRPPGGDSREDGELAATRNERQEKGRNGR